MGIVTDAERRLKEVTAKSEAMTIELLKKEFDTGYIHSSSRKIKHTYMEKVING